MKRDLDEIKGRLVTLAQERKEDMAQLRAERAADNAARAKERTEDNEAQAGAMAEIKADISTIKGYFFAILLTFTVAVLGGIGLAFLNWVLKGGLAAGVGL